VIGPLTVAYINRVLDMAGEEPTEAILLELETPGGLDTSMRDIIKRFLASDIPVIVYVHPSGARAASAGVFITMAAHIAAMTPGTNIGSASPVAMGGQMDSTMTAKVTNDAAAYARSIATERGRNAEWAEAAVLEAVNVTALEAVDLNIIDLVSESVEELLTSVDGRVIELPTGDRVIYTAEARIEPVALTFRERVLTTLADPNIAYIFMMLGIYGLIFELQNPGAIFPGVVGAICLVLAFMSFQTLPLNIAGLALIALAIVLFILEIKITSYGVLSVGGVVAMLLGSLMLIDTAEPALRVSLGVIIIAVALTALFFMFAVGLGIRAQRARVATGSEGLVGELGEAATRLDPTGKVNVHGEIWRAESATGETIDEGAAVEVVQVAGLRLLVQPASRSRFDTPVE
jgi:membrane-bound serine protease (ClpP class)